MTDVPDLKQTVGLTASNTRIVLKHLAYVYINQKLMCVTKVLRQDRNGVCTQVLAAAKSTCKRLSTLCS